MLSKEMQEIIKVNRESKLATKGLVYTPEVVLGARAGVDQFLGALPVPEEIEVKAEVINGIQGELYRYKNERSKDLDDKIVLFIHGGGFMTGSVASRRFMCTTALKYAKMDAFSMEYTQFPEGEHPEELVDAIRAWKGLLGKGYKAENIILFGESGGAMICLMLTLWLKDHQKTLPEKVCVFSPPTNLLTENESRTAREERDPMIHENVNEELAPFFSREDMASKYVSTVNADFEGFPKLLINVGSEEVLFDDSVLLAEQARQAGVDVELKIWDELFHVFTIFPAPETEEALQYIGSFLTGTSNHHNTEDEESIFDKIFSQGKEKLKVINQDAAGGFAAEQITERLYKIRVPGNVCAFLAIGEDKAALIDTGFGTGSIKAFVETITDKPLVVILTHGHFDHVGGASEFTRAFIPEKDFDLALAHSDIRTRVQGLASHGVETTEEQMTPCLNPSQLISYQPEAEFDLGGYTIKMLPMYGHTPGCHCALFVEDRVILLGDACNSIAFMYVEGCCPVEEYRDNLIDFKRKYETLYDTPVYSHPHNFGDKGIVDEMIELCTNVLDPDYSYFDVSALLGEGICAAKQFDEGYKNVDGTTANIVYRIDNLRKNG